MKILPAIMITLLCLGCAHNGKHIIPGGEQVTFDYTRYWGDRWPVANHPTVDTIFCGEMDMEWTTLEGIRWQANWTAPAEVLDLTISPTNRSFPPTRVYMDFAGSNIYISIDHDPVIWKNQTNTATSVTIKLSRTNRSVSVWDGGQEKASWDQHQEMDRGSNKELKATR